MKLKNQRGMSLLEVIISIGVLGLVATGIQRVVVTHGQQVQSAKDISASSQLANDLITSGKRLLSEVKSRTSPFKNTTGICKWAHPAHTNPGIGTVKLHLPPLAKSTLGFSDERWRVMFPNWNFYTEGCQGENNYTRCVKPTNSILNKKEFRQYRGGEWKAKVSFSPLYVNPGKGYFAPVDLASGTTTIEPVSDIAFKFEAKLTYNRNNKNYTKTYESILWAPSVGTCDYPGGLKLSLSGMGSSDPSGRTLYNIASYTASVDPLEVEFLKTQAQVGQITSNGGFISTNRAQNIAVSCNEKKFQCPNLPSNQRVYDALDVKMFLEYKPTNSLAGHATQMSLIPSFGLRKGTVDAAYDTSASTEFFVDGKTESQTKFAVTGHQTLDINIKNGDNNATNMCRQVCQKSTEYNTAGDYYSNKFRPRFSYQFEGYPDAQFYADADSSVGCTACYMKNCSQLGLGTFGPMHQQPYQPLDSNLPECWVNETISENAYTFNGSDFDGEGCVKARLTGNPGEIRLAPENCDQELPVLCYNFGSFSLAEEIQPTSKQLIQKKFENAHNACFKMGKEILDEGLDIEDDVSIDDYVNRSGSTYSFINIAHQGLFLAPQIKEDVQSYFNWKQKNGLTQNLWVWTNLRYRGQKIYAPPPPINPNRQDKEIAVASDNTGRLKVIKANIKIDSMVDLNQSPDQNFLLLHNLRFKGAVRAATNQSKSFRVLCMKDDEIIIPDAKTNNSSQAERICENIDAKFTSPASAVGWVKALLAVKPLDSYYPSPMLANFDDIEQMDPLWVSKKPVTFDTSEQVPDEDDDPEDSDNEPRMAIEGPSHGVPTYPGRKVRLTCINSGKLKGITLYKAPSSGVLIGARPICSEAGPIGLIGLAAGIARNVLCPTSHYVTGMRVGIYGMIIRCSDGRNRGNSASHMSGHLSCSSLGTETVGLWGLENKSNSTMPIGRVGVMCEKP